MTAGRHPPPPGDAREAPIVGEGVDADGPRGRARDLSRILPWVGAFLLVSPLVRLFADERAWAGVPLIVWYVFGCWAALIAAAAALSTRAKPEAASRREDGS